MDDSKNSYSGILKSISLFGGVKVFQILISIIRSKVVAVLLGPEGMGISGLLQSTASTINSIVCCGLDVSAVKSISSSANNYSPIIITLRLLILITGAIGLVLTFVLAPWLSDIAFGNREYATAFRIVSISLLLGQITLGQTALLQGTFHYKDMAKSSLYGSITGLLVVIPLYYIWGVKSIPYVIVLTALIALFFSHFYSRRIPIEKKKLSKKELRKNSKDMLSLGLSLATVGIVNAVTAYLLRIYISKEGGIDVVGLYNAAFAIANTYIGMVLMAMTTDYVPRLSACSGETGKMCDLVNKQIVLLSLLLLPLASIFMLFIKPVVILLYSSRFLPIMIMLLWVMFGMFFRGISWAFSYTFVSRGDSGVFFINETITAIYTLLFSIAGFCLWQLEGLGVAFVLSYVLYTIQMYFLCKKRIAFRIDKETLRLLIICLILLIVCFLASRLIQGVITKYSVGGVFTAFSCYFAFIELSKRVNIKSHLIAIVQKHKKS